MDYGAYNQSNTSRENYFLHPDDAAIPPVVRTSKPPSGFSPLTAPKKPASLQTRIRPDSIGTQSTGSKDNDDNVSIGNLSIEPGVAARSSASIKSAGSGSRNFLKNRKGLLYMGSKERLQANAKDKEEKRTTRDSGEAGYGLGIDVERREQPVSPGATLECTPGDEKLRDEAASTVPGAKAPKRSPGNSPNLGQSNLQINVENGSPGGIGSGRFIPNRDSSLRHTESSSHQKRRSYRASEDLAQAVQDVESDYGPPEKISDTTEEDNVAKRIKELKAQKKKREDRPAVRESDISLPEGGPVRQSSTLPTRPPNAPSKGASTLTSTELERKAPVLEVQVLEDEASAPSPAILQRKDRKSGAQMSFTNNKVLNMQPPSAETSLDLHKSSRASIQRSNSRFKRFSRPGSSDGTDKHRRTISNPLSPQGIPAPVVEERPSSADSIDYAVDEYLSAPRLSQKIKHPQTGRVISFSEVGNPSGFAVFCCVGMGLTRYLTAFYDELAVTLNLRLITPDRPGVGESEPYADDMVTPLAWPGENTRLLFRRSVSADKLKMMSMQSAEHSRLPNSPSSLIPRVPSTPWQRRFACPSISEAVFISLLPGFPPLNCHYLVHGKIRCRRAPYLTRSGSSDRYQPRSSRPPTRLSSMPRAPASPAVCPSLLVAPNGKASQLAEEIHRVVKHLGPVLSATGTLSCILHQQTLPMVCHTPELR